MLGEFFCKRLQNFVPAICLAPFAAAKVRTVVTVGYLRIFLLMQQKMFVRTALAERAGPFAAVREFQMNFGLVAVERNGNLNLGSFGNSHGAPIGCFFGDICHKNDKAEKSDHGRMTHIAFRKNRQASPASCKNFFISCRFNN